MMHYIGLLFHHVFKFINATWYEGTKNLPPTGRKIAFYVVILLIIAFFWLIRRGQTGLSKKQKMLEYKTQKDLESRARRNARLAKQSVRDEDRQAIRQRKEDAQYDKLSNYDQEGYGKFGFKGGIDASDDDSYDYDDSEDYNEGDEAYGYDYENGNTDDDEENEKRGGIAGIIDQIKNVFGKIIDRFRR